MNTRSGNNIEVFESDTYTIIRVPKYNRPPAQTNDTHFNAFVGMLEGDHDLVGKTPVEAEDIDIQVCFWKSKRPV